MLSKIGLKCLKIMGWLARRSSVLCALLSLVIPITIRSIPTLISWPYPIGFDTIRYINTIEAGSFFSHGFMGFLKGTNLFYALASLPYIVTSNAVLVMDALGPLLFGVLCFMMYLFSKKVLSWGDWKSLLLSLLVSVYFVSLRNSWDLYRQTLGLIFLFAVFISLKTFKTPTRYYISSAFMVLTVLSHELAAVILFFVILVDSLTFLVKKSMKEFAYLIASIILPIVLFFYRLYSPVLGTVVIPNVTVASASSTGLTLNVVELLLYCYGLLVPFAILGVLKLKDSFLKSWVFLCLLILVLELLDPNLPFYLWYRWVLILVYPVLFFAVQGIDNLWQYSSKFKRKFVRNMPKFFAILYIFFLVMLGSFYLTSSPNNPFPFFSQSASILSSVPSSMLQNSVSLQDNPSIVSCFNWLNSNANSSSAIVEHYALFDLAVVYVSNHTVIPFAEETTSPWSGNANVSSIAQSMLLTVNQTLANSYDAVYTVWWVNGKGWYGITSLPSDFKEVYSSGNMAVYIYN